MYFIAAVGLYCSARSRNSWRSLLATVAIGYLGGFVLFCVSTPLACLTSVILGLLTTFFQELFAGAQISPRPPFRMAWEVLLPVFWFVGTALTYYWAARSFLAAAERHIARQDRIPTGRVRLIDLDLPLRSPRPARRPFP